MTSFRIIKLMFYSHLSKEIMLLKLKMKKNSFMSYFIISLKWNYRNFNIILKIHFKRFKFVIRLSLQKRFIFFISKKIMNYVFTSIIAN